MDTQKVLRQLRNSLLDSDLWVVVCLVACDFHHSLSAGIFQYGAAGINGPKVTQHRVMYVTLFPEKGMRRWVYTTSNFLQMMFY